MEMQEEEKREEQREEQYEGVRLCDVISIEEIVSVHYFQYKSNFAFPGESHDFWELICVDYGEIRVVAGEREIPLRQGELYFHRPGEFHNVLTDGRISPSLVVIGFFCRSSSMERFSGKLLSVDEREKELLGRIVREASSVFSGRMDDPYQKKLRFSRKAPFGGAQLIRQYLSELLISLYRRSFSRVPAERGRGERGERGERYRRIVRYMESHIREKLTISRICRDNLIGSSQLQKIFRRNAGIGAIELFSRMKIEEAKRMIREGGCNMTEISDRLGYSSVHYFSRQFKKLAAMSPTAYESSIRSLSEKKG